MFKFLFALLTVLAVSASAVQLSDFEASRKELHQVSRFVETGTNDCENRNQCSTAPIKPSEFTREIKISGTIRGDKSQTRVGFQDTNGKNWWIKLNGCCELAPSGRDSCIPKSECSNKDFQIHWDLVDGTVRLESADGRGAFRFFEAGASALKTGSKFIVEGGDVVDFLIDSKELAHIESHIAKGAKMAHEGSCPSGDGARCGDSCWGTCNTYCMCYPNGYTGFSGKFHAGAHCLNTCSGTDAEAPAEGANDAHHLASADDEIRAFLDLDDDGFDDETLEALVDLLVAMAELERLTAELAAYDRLMAELGELTASTDL